jgi:hypothetical protein
MNNKESRKIGKELFPSFLPSLSLSSEPIAGCGTCR